MLFSWANKQLERLSETMAPLSNAATGRFILALQQNDINTAQYLLSTTSSSSSSTNDNQYNNQYNSSSNSTGGGNEDEDFVHPHETIFYPHNSKQSKAIHMACQYSNKAIFTYILDTFYNNVDLSQILSQTDAMGNTLLHYASSSTTNNSNNSNSNNGLSFVQHMVGLYKSYNIQHCIAQKNNQGQTPYDVSTNDLIRQYLLPIILQIETQQCLDNGGIGLPKGIDLGGLRIQNSHIAPPPTTTVISGSGTSGGTSSGTSSGNNSSSHNHHMNRLNSRYAIPTEYTTSTTTMMYSSMGNNYTTTHTPSTAATTIQPTITNTTSTTNTTTNSFQSLSSTNIPLSSTIHQPIEANTTNLNTVDLNNPNNQLSSSSSSSLPTSLPEGWIELIDPSSNTPYYCNQSLNLTQWEKPCMNQNNNNDIHNAEYVENKSTSTSTTNTSNDGNDEGGTKSEETTSENDNQNIDTSTIVEETNQNTNVIVTSGITDNVTSITDKLNVTAIKEEKSEELVVDLVSEEKVEIENNKELTSTDDNNAIEKEDTINNADDKELTGKKIEQDTTSSTQQQSEQLPKGWIALFDESSGSTYYYNQETNVSQWEKPIETNVSVPSIQQPLPIGWVQLVDPASGSPYYYHQSSNMTQWDRPTDIALNASTTATTYSANKTNKASQPKSKTSTSSGSYARRGYSTAGVMPANSKYKPDGFHSSSSDKNLQQKYGHDSSITGPPSGFYSNSANTTPPPLSGGYVHSTLGQNPYASGQSFASNYHNDVNSGGYVDHQQNSLVNSVPSESSGYEHTSGQSQQSQFQVSNSSNQQEQKEIVDINHTDPSHISMSQLSNNVDMNDITITDLALNHPIAKEQTTDNSDQPSAASFFNTSSTDPKSPTLDQNEQENTPKEIDPNIFKVDEKSNVVGNEGNDSDLLPPPSLTDVHIDDSDCDDVLPPPPMIDISL